MRAVRLRPYLRACKAMSLDEAATRWIEGGIPIDLEAHPMVKGFRGVRKARFALLGRGKRWGRVVHHVTLAPSVLFMLMACPKNEQDDLSEAQREQILNAIDGIEGGAP